MEQIISLQDILSEKISAEELLDRLRKRIRHINHGKDARRRGAEIQNAFPDETAQTLQLAEEAMNGMLVLPGTGPELYYAGIPTRWEYNPVQNNEYTFHLNRMPHLKTLAEAYSLTGEPAYAQRALQELELWIDTVLCPPLFDEQGHALTENFEGLSPWRALEVGIRGYRTWPIIIELLAEYPGFTPAFLEKLLVSVHTHCQVLYRISPLLWPNADHNHYLMENLGLMSLSLLFPEMKDSRNYLLQSQRELDRCMDAQCTPGGGQIEGCPSYHNGCVFWFAMRKVFADHFGITVPEAYVQKLDLMFAHSAAATRACGGNFPWGDSHSRKETVTLAATACYMATQNPEYLQTALWLAPASSLMEDIRDNLWRIPDPEALRRTVDEAVSAPRMPSLPLVLWQRELNQVYIRTGWQKDAISLMTACRSPIQNNHAHIDAGSFDMTAFGEPLVSDPGIYTYKDDEFRKHFKSAFWHNCLTVNHRNMWEYVSSWSYGPQKKGEILSVSESPGLIWVSSRHYNYDPAVAVRCLALVERKFLAVIDQVAGLGANDSVQIHFHIDRTQLSVSDCGLLSRSDGHPNVELGWDPKMEAELETGQISTAIDVSHDSTLVHLQYTMRDAGTFSHGALIIPHRAGDDSLSCTFLRQEHTPEGFRLDFRLGQKDYSLLWDGLKLTAAC